ncbi:MAG: hypothetical protein P8O69_05500, partial [Amylibacter sp.]|nr:hypothetical protein [Amylibacter sp.]
AFNFRLARFADQLLDCWHSVTPVIPISNSKWRLIYRPNTANTAARTIVDERPRLNTRGSKTKLGS